MEFALLVSPSGWKLPDLMFASKRGLNDACNSIAKQLESVYSSISATKRGLSSRMDVMDSTLDECAEITSETQQEVSELRKRTDFVGVDVINIHDAVQTLETKISRIEGKQALPSSSSKLALEQPPTTPSSKVAPSSSYRPALELPPISPSSRSASLPPVLSAEPLPSSGSNGSHQVKRPLQNAVSGLQDISGISEVVEASRNHEVSNGNQALEDTNGGASSYGRFGLRFPSISTSFLSRTRSATNAMLQQTRSSSQQ
ncbi:hypothetical protein CFP56_009319 [Quercus suber]|uniref:DUF1664 domain-containing protein n=1 Tax=Quercus suber TaxID=58331 RepID=A0AAW0L3J6_QUESU